MCPLVDLLRPRLDRLLAVDVSHAQRSENAHDLVHRDVAELVDHDQVYQVVHVREATTVECVDRHAPVQTARPNMPARLIDSAGVSAQTLNEVARTCGEIRCQATIAALNMDDQSAVNTRGLDYLAPCFGPDLGRQRDTNQDDGEER